MSNLTITTDFTYRAVLKIVQSIHNKTTLTQLKKKVFCFLSINMEKAINKQKTEISDLVAEHKELANIHNDKVSKYLKNEFYFKQMEEDYNEMDDFEKLKQFYFDLGVEFRQFVIEYNINHDLIKEKTIDIFLKQK